MTNIIFSPVGVFVLFTVVVSLIYFWSGTISPKMNLAGGKGRMYTGGESLPEKKHNPNAQMFFHIALFFTVIDVAALMAATLPVGASPVLGVFYLLGMSAAVFALIIR